MSQKLMQAIKKAAIEAVEQSSPMAMVYGTVTKISPLEINIDQKLTLSIDFIARTRTFNSTVFEVGDRLLLLREEGGQKYVFIDKLVI